MVRSYWFFWALVLGATALVWALGAGEALAQASGDQIFGEVERRGQELVDGLRRIANITALVAFIVVALVAFFTGFKGRAFVMVASIGGGVFLIAIATRLVEWLNPPQ